MNSGHGTINWGTPPIAVGERFYFTAGTGIVEGHTVRLRRAELTGVPSGMQVVGIYGVNLHEYARHSTIGALPEDLPGGVHDLYPDLKLHPVTDALLDKRETTGWYIVVVAAGTKPGDFESTGITMDYTDVNSGETGTAHYDMHIRLHVVDATPLPTPSSAPN